MTLALLAAAHIGGAGFLIALLIALVVAALVFWVASMFLPPPVPVLLAVLVFLAFLFWP